MLYPHNLFFDKSYQETKIFKLSNTFAANTKMRFHRSLRRFCLRNDALQASLGSQWGAPDQPLPPTRSLLPPGMFN